MRTSTNAVLVPPSPGRFKRAVRESTRISAGRIKPAARWKLNPRRLAACLRRFKISIFSRNCIIAHEIRSLDIPSDGRGQQEVGFFQKIGGGCKYLDRMPHKGIETFVSARWWPAFGEDVHQHSFSPGFCAASSVGHHVSATAILKIHAVLTQGTDFPVGHHAGYVQSVLVTTGKRECSI